MGSGKGYVCNIVLIKVAVSAGYKVIKWKQILSTLKWGSKLELTWTENHYVQGTPHFSHSVPIIIWSRCVPIFLVGKIRPGYKPNPSDSKTPALNTTLCCYYEDQYCSIFKHSCILRPDHLSSNLRETWLTNGFNLKVRGIRRDCQCPFHSCFLSSFQFTPLSATIFPHENYDKFPIPISFSWFLPLKLKLKFHPVQAPLHMHLLPSHCFS